MLIAAIAILIVGAVLFLLSYFMNDRIEELENKLEQFSNTNVQDTYQIKKKIQILEEEFLPEQSTQASTSKPINK